MKKLMIIPFLLLMAAVTPTEVYAQLKEVKGVEIRKTCYQDCNPDGTFAATPTREKDALGDTIFKYPKVGFEFVNRNKFQITLETELWWEGTPGYNYYPAEAPQIIDTKSFVLEPGETYVWKTNLSNETYGGGVRADKSPEKHYVKYKAYKNE